MWWKTGCYRYGNFGVFDCVVRPLMAKYIPQLQDWSTGVSESKSTGCFHIGLLDLVNS